MGRVKMPFARMGKSYKPLPVGIGLAGGGG
jgi:hypothetical protein